MIIQFLLSLILLAAVAMTVRRVKQDAMRWREAFAWILLWVGIGVVIWRPDTTTVVARLVGIGRGADLVLYAAVIGLLIMVFQLHVAHERLERQLTELVRKKALEGLKHETNVFNSWQTNS